MPTDNGIRAWPNSCLENARTYAVPVAGIWDASPAVLRLPVQVGDSRRGLDHDPTGRPVS
jgi:hypothetical protein